MPNNLSPSIRLAYRQPGYAVTATQIEQELFMISHGAVGRITAGMSIKAQLQQAWINLGRPSWWRLKSAWYRDGSGSWSAAAVIDFQARYRAFQTKEAARLAHNELLRSAPAAQPEPEYVRLARADYQALVSRIAALEATASSGCQNDER